MKYWLVGFCSYLLFVVTLDAQTLDTFNPNPNDRVFTVAVQPDGGILTMGNFFAVDGLPRDGMARLNPDGSLDPFFNPGAALTASCLAVQPDGKIIVAGSFTNLAGQACTNLGRLNADGTFDFSFNSLAQNSVDCLMLQPDGKIIVGGNFTNLAGQSCNRIGRLNPDGSLDTNFNASASKLVMSVALQPDGKILVGGSFSNLDGTPVTSIGRLNSDGSLDNSFNSSASGSVRQIIVESDSTILVAGSFTNLAGAPRNRIGRLNNDGAIDSTFIPDANNNIFSMALQANGKILIVGSFTTLDSVTRNHIGRLNSDGTLDTTFNPGANSDVYSIAIQPDGKIVLAGTFTNLAGGPRNYIGRLSNNTASAQSLDFTPSSVTWMRGGSAPETWNSSFELSTNGTDWTFLADGIQIPGGWQASGLTIPVNASIRARGFVPVTGIAETSSSLLQQIAGIPVVTAQPFDTESVPKTNVTLTATVDGTPPLAYQWQFNGTNLINGPKIFGATNASLVLSNVTTTNMGVYALIVTNSYGSVTSRLASLKIVSSATNDNFSVSLGITYTTAIQSDQKILLGGPLNAAGPVHRGLARATFNGVLDESFQEQLGAVYAVAVQADDNIVIGGTFIGLSGQVFTNIVRLHPDGAPDASFTNTVNGGAVYAIALQPDGKILLGGIFTLLGNQPHNNIGRLNADGSLDTNFNAAADSTINTVALQANGKIVIAGTFTNVNGVKARGLARLNSDGTLDSTFAAVLNTGVSNVAVQPNGKILISGPFLFVNGGYWDNFLARLNPDGSLDTTFNAFPTSPINTIALQSDGKAFLGGSFSSISGSTASSCARINPDGTFDFTFSRAASGEINSLGIQSDGSLLVTALGNVSRMRNTEPVSHLVTYDGSTVTWVRNGPAPECSWVMFDSSSDGTNWSFLGMGSYANNTWQISDISLPPSRLFRARGYVVGGYHNGSGWMMEARSGPPFFLTNPMGVTNSSATLTGFVTGTPPFAYQWLKDGLIVTNIPLSQVFVGIQTPSLLIRSINGNQVGNYTLVASNAFGMTTSSVASVSALGPWVVSQPVSITTNAGATVSYSAEAFGKAPLYYQWFIGTQPLTNSGNISGATSPTLTLSNVTSGDSGSYSVFVTNSSGTASSSAATLTVIELSRTPPEIISGSVGLNFLTNGFGFDLTASAGQTVIIETSTNFIDWEPVFTNTIDSNPLHFHDSSAITNRMGFYRVRLQ